LASRVSSHYSYPVALTIKTAKGKIKGVLERAGESSPETVASTPNGKQACLEGSRSTLS